MPKRIITRSSLPKIMRELDRWEGKLTWSLFCDRVAVVLGVGSVSRHAMYLYPAVKERFQRRQKEVRAEKELRPRDFTVEVAGRRIAELEAQVNRLEEVNRALLDQFRRWQYNAYANNARMDLLAWDKALPEVDRTGKPRSRYKRAKGSG